MQNNNLELFINLTLLFVRQNHIVWLLCGLAFLVTAVLIPITIKICNKEKWYDSLDERKIHSGNIPRLGSIGFVTGFVVSAIVYMVIKNDAASSLVPFVLAGFIIFLFGHWQGEDEFGADAFGADDVDVFIVGVDDLFHDGEAEAGALLILAAGEVGLVKAVPDQF